MWPTPVFTRFPGRRGVERILLAEGSIFFWMRTMSFSRGVSVEGREGSGVRWMRKGKFQRGLKGLTLEDIAAIRADSAW